MVACEWDIKGFSENCLVNYVDDDIAIINSFKGLSSNRPIKLKAMLVINCESGVMCLRVNGKHLQIHPNELFFCRPDSVINNWVLSSDFAGKALVISDEIMQPLLRTNNDVWQKAFYIANNPILHLEREDYQVLNSYRRLTKLHINRRSHSYHKDIIRCLFYASFYELCAILDKFVCQEETLLQKQGDLLFQKFLSLVAQDKAKNRSVAYYGEMLCISPQYLSTVCRQTSGRTPLDWITLYTIEEIRYLLKFSDLSIKEIAYELNFPSLSCFGKYFKTYVGVSPRIYRERAY